MDIIALLCQEFHLKKQQCENVLKLIDDGNTIPFIARYRKEMTDSLDDQVLREIFERLQYLRGLGKLPDGNRKRPAGAGKPDGGAFRQAVGGLYAGRTGRPVPALPS